MIVGLEPNPKTPLWMALLALCLYPLWIAERVARSVWRRAVRLFESPWRRMARPHDAMIQGLKGARR
jgi:hypothetical protein